MAHQEGNVVKGHLETATLEGKNKVLGFWLFLAAETVLFACLIGSYLALWGSHEDFIQQMSQTNPNLHIPTSQELFSMPLVAVSTALLLTSSLTSVLAMNAMHAGKQRMMQIWLGITLALGFSFLMLEIYEFYHYTTLGHTMMSSAFGSAFYTLLGTHGVHVTFGIIWIFTLMLQTAKRGINAETAPKLYLSSLYWHFIDVVWVFIFTLVYLLGMVG